MEIKSESIEHKLNQLNLESSSISAENEFGEKWDFELRSLYVLATKFYKEKNGKAIHLNYEDNLKLVAFSQQAIHGQLDLAKASPLGMFDVIGKDRRMAWANLGNLSKGQSMEGFIDLLDRLCPSFKPYIEAIREEKSRLAAEQEKHELEQKEQEKVRLEAEQRIEDERNREEVQRRQLQDALNQQTYYQFKLYAEKQFPNNPEQQGLLIRQLQNEHYHQYMQQLQAQMSTIDSERRTGEGENAESSEPDDDTALAGKEVVQQQVDEKEACESDSEADDFTVIAPPNMWTRPDIKIFKQEVSASTGDGVIRIGHGDTVTVRVPTHEGGTCLFWEFATDSYDLGFGVYFEWGKPQNTEVSVHISESDEEEEDLLEEDDAEELTSSNDLECGPPTAQSTQSINDTAPARPPISIIVPVYRRDCQNEVYSGSHNYPGEGTYLLKFDNSYSLWRSKTLYYRVFYTR